MSAVTLERALEIVKDLPEKMEQDERAFKKPDILEALAIIRRDDPTEFDLIIKPITESGVKRKSISKELDKIDQKWAREFVKKKGEVPYVSEEIKAKAEEILKHGNPIQFIANSCGRMVLGADRSFKKLICCISAQNVRQSSGLHPKLNGASSGGKTLTVMMFAHHLPSEMVNKGSMSAKAAFYHGFKARSFNLIDDYRAGGNLDLDTVIKQTSSVFHQEYEHKTVIDGKAGTLAVGPEQTWAITSIDASQDIQVLNRQIMINVDDSEKMTRQVNIKTIDRYGNGEILYAEDDQVLISREIFRILRNEGYIDVRIPFKDRIQWLDASNRRNPTIFLDLLISITAMNRFQRERDTEGYYLATEDDFHAAKALYIEKDSDEIVHRLTKKEKEFAELLSKNSEGLTKAESANKLDVTRQRISQLANSLGGKMTGFQELDITDFVETSAGKRAIRSKLYKLSGYNPLEGFDAIVKLIDTNPQPEDTEGNLQRKGPQLSTKGRRKVDERVVERLEETNNINNSRIDSELNCVQRKGEMLDEAEKNISFSPVILPEKNIFLSQSDENPFAEGKPESSDQIGDFHRGFRGLSATFIDSSKTFRRRADIEQEGGSEPTCLTCLVCDEPIGQNHSSYYGKFCSYCGPKIPMVRAAAKAHPKGFTVSEIWEDLASRGNRPPRKEHLPAMLKAVGCTEDNGLWMASA